MSLQVTHIRFAKDLSDMLSISDLDMFISGTVYPDTRYITGIDRAKTHDAELMRKFHSADEFVRGMAAHYLCDELTNEIRDEWFEIEGEHIWGGDYWITSTAMKIIQNLKDFKGLNVHEALSHLTIISPRNGESPDLIRKFFDVLKKVYSVKQEITIEDEMKIWSILGLDNDRFHAVYEKTKEFQKNAELVQRIEDVYDESIARAKQFLKDEK